MEWLLFAGLIVGNFLTFGTIKVVKDNKTREFSLGKVVNYVAEKIPKVKMLDPVEQSRLHNELLEQQAREEADELLEPYDHALRNIEEENRIEEQKITKIEKIIEAEKRKKELHESVKKLSEAAREFGISLEEIEDRRYHIGAEKDQERRQKEVILENLMSIEKSVASEEMIFYKYYDCYVGEDNEGVNSIYKYSDQESVEYKISTQLICLIFIKFTTEEILEEVDDDKVASKIGRVTGLPFEVVMEYVDIDALRQELVRKKQEKQQQTQDWINTKIRAHNQPIIEKRLLRDLEDIVERIDKEDKRPLKQIDKIARNPEDLKNILKHHKPNTFKYEIASKIFMIIMYELSYEEIVTDSMQQTFLSISAATNLEVETWKDYIDIGGLRRALRRYQAQDKTSFYVDSNGQWIMNDTGEKVEDILRGKSPQYISIHGHVPYHETWRGKEELREEINRWKEMPF